MPYQFNIQNLEREFILCLPERLRLLRKQNHMNQQDVAAPLHIDRSTYAYYETGTTQPPLSILVKLALLYDVTTDFLLGYPQKKRQPSAFELELLLLMSKYFENE